MHLRLSFVIGLAVSGCSLVRVDPAVQAEYEAVRAELNHGLDGSRAGTEADLQVLTAQPWMRDRTCVHDASALLHPMFGFDDSTYINRGVLTRSSYTEAEFDAVFKAARKRTETPEGHHWMTQGATPEVQAVSLPWVAELRAFDCWNITAHHPWREVDPAEFWGIWMPSPTVSILGAASRVLLMQLHAPTTGSASADAEQVRQTLEDVRHLASLCIQGQERFMAMIGADILTMEREAVEYLSAQGRVPAGWQPVPKEHTDSLLRILDVGPAFFSLLTARRHHDLISSPSFSVGRCAAIREGARAALGFHGLLEATQLKWIHGVLDQGPSFGCHVEELQYLRDKPGILHAHHAPLDNPLMPPAMRRSEAMLMVGPSTPSHGWPHLEE